jgi:hypothetical protein
MMSEANDHQVAVVDRMVRAQKAVASRGGTPSLAPNWLFEYPIWHSPDRAKRHNHFYYEREDRRYDPIGGRRFIVVETVNPIAKPLTGNRRISSDGLLQWRDFDLVVAISRIWCEQKRRRIQIRMQDLLGLMGYDEAKRFPYRELFGSVERLRVTQLIIREKGAEGRDQRPFTILVESKIERIHNQRGKPQQIVVQPSEYWMSMLSDLEGWTAFDFDCYNHLLRMHIRQGGRSVYLGMARTIYMWLASHPSIRYGSFKIPIRELVHDFAEREHPNGPFLHRNRLGINTHLGRALQLLRDEGMAGWSCTKAGMLEGELKRPPGIESLVAMRHRLSADTCNSSPCLPMTTELESISVQPGIEPVTPQLSTDKLLSDEAPDSDLSEPITTVEKAEAESASQMLIKSYPAIAYAVHSAEMAGWERIELLTLLAYSLMSKSVKNPPGFIAQNLITGSANRDFRRRWNWDQLKTEFPEADSIKSLRLIASRRIREHLASVTSSGNPP